MRRPPPRWGAVRVVLAALVAAVTILGSPIGAAPTALSATGVTIEASPRWGPVPPSSWTPYRVMLGNQGGADVDGEVVLVPRSEPPPQPGERPSPPTTTLPTSSTVLALGGRGMTAPAPRGPAGTTEIPEWPTYRAPVTLPASTDKTLTIMVLEAPFGYDAELRDATGGLVASAPGPPPTNRGCAFRPGARCRTSVLVLSELAGAKATLEALGQQVVPNLELSQLRSARDFPDTALHLAGLDAIVIDDFDTATLTANQRRALQDYVSLGGSLLLAGGGAWTRTLPALPAGLVPLEPSTSADASLGPLAEFADSTTAAVATVVTGEIRAGRVVVAGPEGPPLVVEFDYRAGRVVQLGYDPLAEPIASEESLRALAWAQGLGRVTSRWGNISGSAPQAVAEDQLWASVLDARAWPSWPRWSLGFLVLYGLAIGPATFVSSKRGHLPGVWMTLALAAVLGVGVCLVAAQLRPHTSQVAVELRTLGANGTVLTTSYRGLRSLDPPQTITAVPGAAVSSVFSGDPVLRTIGMELDPLVSFEPHPRGMGGGSVDADGGQPTLALPARPWALRTLQTVSIDHGGAILEASLRLVGGSTSSPGRVVGTVTNHGPSPLRQVRAQIPQGQAHLVDVLAAGASADVDAPVVAIRSASEDDLLPATPEDLVVFAAASRAFTAPGQIAVVGVAGEAAPSQSTSHRNHGQAHHVAVVAVVGLESSETVVAGAGGGRRVTATTTPGGDALVVFEMSVSPGVAPLSVKYPARLAVPGLPEPPGYSVEAYNWRTRTWRSLPSVGRPQTAYVETPLDEAEVNDGLVRVRHRTDSDAGLSAIGYSQLLLTSDSEDPPARG